MAIEVTKERTVQSTVKYVKNETPFKGKVYVVIGKELENKSTGNVYTKGLWINKADIKAVAPLLLDTVKEYAPELLQH